MEKDKAIKISLDSKHTEKNESKKQKLENQMVIIVGEDHQKITMRNFLLELIGGG